MTKKIQLKKPFKKLNNKKGLTLVELIFAVMQHGKAVFFDIFVCNVNTR